ncbi:MAG: IPT/TIG domain-containing protein [Solirubrobacteraceae bacterium]
MLAVALGALAVSLLLSPGALAARDAAKHACAAPLPGRAACLAMRLLVPSGTAGAQPAATGRAAGARAAVTYGKPFSGFLTPERLHEAYGLPNETAAGSTQTIAVVDAFDDPTAEADLAVYDKQFGLAPCTSENGCFKKVNQEGNAGPLPKTEGGWASEVSIDVQMARAICQSCHILLVEAKSEEFSDLGTAVNAAAKAGATEISNSYGGTEAKSFTSLNTAYYNHPGILVAASSGDCGYLNKFCNEDTVGANFPAASGDVLAVGGTSLTESGGVWTSTAWEEGGSGCSTVFSAPLWQSGVADFAATGCGSERAIADVAAIGDPNTGVDVYDSTPEEPGAPTGWGVWGGTSVASPIVAAEFGLAGGAQGVSYPAATLYDHAGEAADLYDVVSGDNGSCDSATICKATTGFDGPTGLGSPIGLGAFAVAGAPESTSPPTITGVAEQGRTLSENHGGWTGSPTSFTYQWERCGPSGTGCQAIAGASASTYTLALADVGQTVRVRETAQNEIGHGSADSAATQTVTSDVPTISGISPPAGITGSTLVVTGTALDTTSQVLVGSLPAAFTVVSPTTLEVIAPDGTKKGKIAVTTAAGSATSKAKFTATLSITSFTPASAAAGSAVTIKGVGFNASSTVSFGGVPAASVSYFSKSKLKATVPANAGTGRVTVTNGTAPTGTVASAQSFTP